MSLPTPYYQDDAVTIYHGDCRELLPLMPKVGLVLTDPPYGIVYESGYNGSLPRSIKGDDSTELRDWLLRLWLPRPLAMFGSWKSIPPVRPRGCLVWHKNAGGMGDLAFPWAPTFELIWVYGDGWAGKRTDAVLNGRTIVSWNEGPAHRLHPHEKPVDVFQKLILKHPAPLILDPFMGSGTTLRAAKDLGRKAIGIEISEEYCEIAARRMAQATLDLGTWDNRSTAKGAEVASQSVMPIEAASSARPLAT